MKHSGAQLRLIAGDALGMRAPVSVHSPLFYLHGRIAANRIFSFPIDSDFEGALYLVSGDIKLGSEIYNAPIMAAFPTGEAIQFESLSKVEFMLLGGEVFETTPYIWWNFVSSSMAKIEQAKSDWRQGRFEPVFNETEYMPSPNG